MRSEPVGNLWRTAEAYEAYMGRWSRSVALLFLTWLGPVPHRRWVDLGCGTGALSAQIARTCQPRSLLGLDLSETFLPYAAGQVPDATFLQGNAADTRLPAREFDYAVSGLVLNFTPDPVQTLREMARLTRPGGQVALYVWDYAGQMQIMRHFFDAARPIDPGSAAFDDGI